SGELQDAILNQLYKRADWTMAFLDAIESKKINLAALGPLAINRLRTHSNADVAARANKLIDALRGPETKEKDALIAKFTPIVTQPGDAVRGKELFAKNCAVCHKFKGAGKDVAPDLTGMGAHGAAELIVHVLDPNRSVEPNYFAYSIETKDGEIYDGVIARENSASVTLRNAAGDMEIPMANIKTRRNTGLSLMPTGFETLGAEILRDILAYLCEGEANFRIIDLQSALTASSLKGLWLTEDNLYDTLDFKKFGVVKVGDVPFEIVNPLKSATGKNLILLKGGTGLAKTYPQRVEVTGVNAKAARLHFLGGVAGWGYPLRDTQKEMPVAKVTVHYADNNSEEFIFKNGVEIADWNGATDVPGSKSASELVKHGQVRWFTKELKRPGIIDSLTIESFDNSVSPAFVAITADSSASPVTDSTNNSPLLKEFKWMPGTTHVLILGGGSSHDFQRWFNLADSATLTALGNVSVNYTENPGDLPSALKDADVLFESSNQPIDSATRKAIFDFADSGHGLLLVHPGLWYNWNDWPDYNRVLVGGGAHGHDKYGEFEVVAKESSHPVMAGVPVTFKISDELYHSEIDPQGTPVEVLAEARNLATGKTYPSVWIVKHPKARIVCIALGHDAKAHDLDAYKSILQNAVKWAAER
ncbi:MAG TPA: ThuA domain-containing protein, partial [Verrucomicrobiae bacterium]|nr:ThuA domain-containing protein [Verrucomicrobiae bacterium]